MGSARADSAGKKVPKDSRGPRECRDSEPARAITNRIPVCTQICPNFHFLPYSQTKQFCFGPDVSAVRTT